MSIAICPHCEEMYDQDFNVEHEEDCQEEIEDEANNYHNQDGKE